MTGQQLKQQRIASGLRPTEFAARLGCTERSLYRFESGERPITPMVERAIKNLLDELVGAAK